MTAVERPAAGSRSAGSRSVGSRSAGSRSGGAGPVEVLAAGRAETEPALRAAVDALPEPVRRVAGYHLGWWDERGEPAAADAGKALRPTLVLLAAEAAGGRAAAAAALPAAVAVELVHNFSLLHDDVMDADRARRHRPTAWTVFGVGAAILAGDALLTQAADVLAASTHPAARPGLRMLTAAVHDLVAGQGADLAFEQRTDVGLAECEAMAARKTGALLGCAAALGGLFGGAEPARIGRLHAFGRHLGIAFQHVDDMLGIWGDPAVTGKPVHSDLRNRRMTLPVVAALGSGTPAGVELAARYRLGRAPAGTGLARADLARADLARVDVASAEVARADVARADVASADLARAAFPGVELARIADLVELAGGRAYCQDQAAGHVRLALRELAAASPAGRAAADLAALAHLTTHRDH